MRTDDEIRAIVIESINYVQDLSGCSRTPIDERTRPINGLRDFDSLRAIEVIIEIESRLGLGELDEALFITEDGNKAESIAVIVLKLKKIMEDEE